MERTGELVATEATEGTNISQSKSQRSWLPLKSCCSLIKPHPNYLFRDLITTTITAARNEKQLTIGQISTLRMSRPLLLSTVSTRTPMESGPLKRRRLNHDAPLEVTPSSSLEMQPRGFLFNVENDDDSDSEEKITSSYCWDPIDQFPTHEEGDGFLSHLFKRNITDPLQEELKPVNGQSETYIDPHRFIFSSRYLNWEGTSACNCFSPISFGR